jgi:hypothetical protein
MDDTSRGISMAAITLQSVMLQRLIADGVVTLEGALQLIDRAQDTFTFAPEEEAADPATKTALTCLANLRRSLVEMFGEQPSEPAENES